MNGSNRIAALLVAAAVTLAAPGCDAQMAVVDVSAITQLVTQVQTLQQVLTNARRQLAQAQQALQTMTGSRGMQFLLPGVVRNYLPSDWGQLAGSLQTLSAGYPALGTSVSALLGANAILSPAQLAALSSQDQQRISAARNLAALGQVMSRSSLANAGSRFSDLQSLIGTIGSATDQKAVLDLQARIAAEQGMLQNEQTKLQSLFQALQAEQMAVMQQQREAIVAGHGTFANRFQPSP
jgi:type IV secretion system protein VirB5